VRKGQCIAEPEQESDIMKVESNITVLSRAVQETGRAEEREDARPGGQTIYAGGLQGDFSLLDRIQQRKERAQKRALKVVGDAWNGDRKIEEEISRSQERLKELSEDKKQLRAELNETAGKSEELMAKYQIEEDSQEQQDLELLKKAGGAQYHWAGIELTEEEEAHVEEIRAGGLTEYQERALELDARAWKDRDALYYNTLEVQEQNAVIRGIREERRKVHPMSDAQERAEDIMESVREEIVGMAVEDSKEHLDKEQEEREEQAGEIKEEKEKQEEILKKREEREDALEELTEELSADQAVNKSQTLSDIKRQVQNILSEMNLVVEDIKGSQVDTSV